MTGHGGATMNLTGKTDREASAQMTHLSIMPTFSSLLREEWFMGYPERRPRDLRIVIFT